MEGRTLAKWVVCGVATVAAVGCNTTPKTVTGQQPQLPGQGESKLSRFLHGGPPGPVANKPEIVERAAKPQPMKTETVVTFADVQVESAYMEGRTPQETNQLLDEARTRYQKVLATDPNNAEAIRGLARLYTRAGDKTRALASYQQLIQAHPKDHKAAHEMALACGRFEDWTTATAACERAIGIDPENRRYHKTLGVCLARTGNYERAFDAMMKGATEAETRYTLATVLLDTKQDQMAREQMELALKADPSYAPAREWLTGGTAPAAEAPGGVVQTGYSR